jgi:hypothetical protein
MMAFTHCVQMLYGNDSSELATQSRSTQGPGSGRYIRVSAGSRGDGHLLHNIPLSTQWLTNERTEDRHADDMSMVYS